MLMSDKKDEYDIININISFEYLRNTDVSF